ncbi:MAG TPA: FemAB family XrtA/PEP-CTERM system-associated protein [Methylomirabilota bacterium]|nr:FemAB family XrtA/PEP-CTERM system-associated protein [Methylomirabilota bacterium]
MEIKDLDTDTAEWDAFVRASGRGSPFHLLAWKRAVQSAFGHRPHYLMATRGGGLEGVLPLFEVRGLLGGRALVSVPYAVYGGICAEASPAREALLGAATERARRVGAKYVELRHRVGQQMDLPTKSLYVTFSRPISSSEEQNLEAIPRKQRRMTRQGVKHGLRAEIGLQHLDRFYDIYAASVHNLGSPVFPRRLFHALVAEFGKECELLSVWRNDGMVAGVLTLLYEDHALPYYGGALREALPFAVNDFMYWELMCHVAGAGYRVFDFGRSREGTGAYNFKRHWGFEPQPLPYQYALLDGATMPNMSPSNPKMRLAVEGWKRLPLPVTRRLGPFLTRFLP